MEIIFLHARISCILNAIALSVLHDEDQVRFLHNESIWMSLHLAHKKEATSGQRSFEGLRPSW